MNKNTAVQFDLLHDLVFHKVFTEPGNEKNLSHLLEALLELEGEETLSSYDILYESVSPKILSSSVSTTIVNGFNHKKEEVDIILNRPNLAIGEEEPPQAIPYNILHSTKGFLEARLFFPRGIKIMGLWIINQKTEYLPKLINKFGFIETKSQKPIPGLPDTVVIQLKNLEEKPLDTYSLLEKWVYTLVNSKNFTFTNDLPKELREVKGIKEAIELMLKINAVPEEIKTIKEYDKKRKEIKRFKESLMADKK